MPRDGGGLITLWTTTAAPGIDIAVDANSVYWLDSNGRPTRLTPK